MWLCAAVEAGLSRMRSGAPSQTVKLAQPLRSPAQSLRALVRVWRGKTSHLPGKTPAFPFWHVSCIQMERLMNMNAT
jgi:hypothetical protein